MTNLTQYSSQELSLVVFNDEYYYNLMKHYIMAGDTNGLKEALNSVFIFTEEQWDELEQDATDYVEFELN